MLVIKFRIGGNLRFLSHAETLRVFQRACVRAGIKIQYSQGFNPHPKLSLPLPRSVGVEADDDLLCLRIGRSTSAQEYKSTSGLRQGLSVSARPSLDGRPDESELCDLIKTGLSQQLPEGLELLSVNVAEANTSPQPSMATYLLVVREEYLDEKLKAGIGCLLASDNLNVQRRINAGKLKIDTCPPSVWRNRKSNGSTSSPSDSTSSLQAQANLSRAQSRESRGIKNVDVRGFLKSIVLEDKCIVVECRISSAGSIRVEEILNLLELDQAKLAAPIRRTNVQWQEIDDRRRMTENRRQMTEDGRGTSDE